MRNPANLPPIPGVAIWEGIVETDIWFGPVFANFRLIRTDTTIHLRSQVPILQVQPIPQLAYREETLASFVCRETDDLSDGDWERLGEALRPPPDPTARLGEYAVAVRKRRMCPFDHSLLQLGTADKA